MDTIVDIIYSLRDNESLTITKNDKLRAIQYKFTVITSRGQRFSSGFAEHFRNMMPADINEQWIVMNLLEIIRDVRIKAQ